MATGDLMGFECQKHGAYLGREITFLSAGKVKPACPCCVADKSLHLNEAIAKDRQANKSRSLIEKLGYSGVPKRFLLCEFSGFQTDLINQANALSIASSYVSDFADKLHDGAGLLFIGNSGTGKTHLAAAICKGVVKQGYSAVFTSTLEFMQVVKETYSKHIETSEREAIQQFASPDLLVLDEVGVQHGSKAERMLMTELINQRYAGMKPTILLTNLDINELGLLLDFRVISRLREVNKRVVFDWPDHRLAGGLA